MTVQSDLVLQAYSDVIRLNTKNTTQSDDQLWTLQYDWTNGNFMIISKSTGMMMSYDTGERLEVIKLTNKSDGNVKWRVKNDSNIAPLTGSCYLSAYLDTTRNRKVILADQHDHFGIPLQVQLVMPSQDS